MMYPSIYSLSTVGILKHYNHDYLFHHKRTDFVGPNGVGKSILADLLQMMFVYEKELIKFGTDDVNGKRDIHKLPHETRCAYCFLNIAVQRNKFITIGIQIHNQERKRIVPFVIAKDADIAKDISAIALNKEDLLFSKDFLYTDIIPDISELADFLNNDRKLKLIFFGNREAVQDYYLFLSNKEILPINLAKENNLKAFAKVIQSFSKAKTLKLSGREASKSLKEFLFEDSDEDIKTAFDKEKYELEKILKEYRRLNDDIHLLGNKQKKLSTLKQQHNNYWNLWKDYKTAELSNCHFDLKAQKHLEKKGHQLLKEQLESLEKLQRTINKLPRIEVEIKKQYEESDKNYGQAHAYRQIVEKIQELNDAITELKMVVLPVIHDDWKAVVPKIDITAREVNDIKREITFAEPYIIKYTTIEGIETSRERQLDEIDRLKAQLNTDKEQKAKLLHLLQNKEENSLLHWYLNNLPILNTSMLQAVLHFATLPTKEMSLPVNKSRFIQPDELNDSEIRKAKEGIWLKSGAISEFILHNPDAGLLIDRSELDQHIQLLNSKLNNEITAINEKLQALNNIRDGLDYSRDLFEYSFDPCISEASKINQLKIAVACILLRDEKVATLQKEKVCLEEDLHRLQEQFNLRYKEPGIVERDLKKVKERWFKRTNKLSGYSATKNAELKSLQKEIGTTRDELSTVTTNITKYQDEFNHLYADYYRCFHENIMEFNEAKNDLNASKRLHENAYETYKRSYIEAVSAFDETKDEKNAEINYELQKISYSFYVLERALLGNKIKSTDDVVTALQEANNNRTQIADGIRDSMIKIFTKTSERYENYKVQIQTINAFFVNRKISGKFYFNVKFQDNPEVNISHVNEMAYAVRQSATRGELQFDQSITDFLEEFFRKLAKLRDRVPIDKLLDPKTYFSLSARLEDQYGEEVPGSTGESYSAIALLGVARLSTQRVKQKGLRFIILEELGSMDNTNFNIFPAIAEEFKYQIITMAPHTFNIGLADEWYAHHLIKGKVDDKINYYPSSSYFKTKDFNEHLSIYLNKVSE